MTGVEAEAAARVLERLLSDPVYRAYFRRNPVGASREAGLPSVAEEIAMGGGKALDTLEDRESRSSLAGVFMAAALEGAAVVDFSKDVLPHLNDVPAAVEKVLTRVQLPAVSEAEAATPRVQGVERIRVAQPDAAVGEFPVVAPAHAAAAAAGVSGAQAEPAGSPTPETLDLLHNKRVSLDADGIGDVKAGKVDPRIVSVITAISRNHTISISTIATGHDKYVAGGGSVSNHFYGRAADVSVVDGQPVSPGNAAARKVAEALSRLPSDIRPTEIGSPWALSGPAYFTDGAHQNHLHIGFDDPISSGWSPPQEVAAAPADDSAPSIDAGNGDDGDDVDEEEAAEPGGLEDPGGDTDAEADAESDGDGDADDSDSVSDDQEDDEGEGEEDDGGDDGDHDDSSDSGSDDTDDSDGSDGGEDSDDSEDSGDGGDSGGSGGSGDGGGQLDLGGVDGTYPGDDASKSEMAAWMGSAAQKRGLPPELPVMASLVESGLRNLGFGDADSVGFFQMRVGIWNQGAYAGYPDNPELQLKWFLDHAVAVKRQRLAAGQPVDEAGSYGEWVADIERPAAQYRGRYQLQLDEARSLLRQGMEERGDVQLEDVADRGGGGGAGTRARAAVTEARKYLGTPYQWGGSTPQTGFDCSGLVQWAYAKAGIRIPRTTYEQVDAPNGRRVDRADLQPGDLVFFRSAGGDVHHVGMSLGGDKFIDAPSTGEKVRIDSLKEPYYANQFYVGRRFDFSGRAPRAAAAGVPANAAGADAPGVDPDAVRQAEAALARDVAEVQRPGTLLFEAVRAQEAAKMNQAQVLKTVDPPS